MEKLYCVQVRDKISNKMLYMNFLASNEVEPPENEPSDVEFLRLMDMERRNVSHEIDRFKIRFQNSQLCKSSDHLHSGYVVLIRINKDFASRIRHNPFKTDFAISVCMSELQDHLNSPRIQQNVGHRFDFDHANYTVLQDKIWVEPRQ